MTSLAFILGVVPLAIASGASSASQQAIGTGVIGGMLSATLAVVFVPVFFVVVMRLAGRRQAREANAQGGISEKLTGQAPCEMGGFPAMTARSPFSCLMHCPPAPSSFSPAAVANAWAAVTQGLVAWQGEPLVAHVQRVVRPLSDDLVISCNRNQEAYRTYADQLVGDAEADFPGRWRG